MVRQYHLRTLLQNAAHPRPIHAAYSTTLRSRIFPRIKQRSFASSPQPNGFFSPSFVSMYPRKTDPLAQEQEKKAEAEEEEDKLEAQSNAGKSSGSSNSGESGNAASSSGSGRSGDDSRGGNLIAKRVVPDIYPQLLALPITRRPLFPGFYKAVIVKDPAVIKAILEAHRRDQPYLGAFLLKDENADCDVISDPNSVHPVGVFCQITASFPIPPSEKDPHPGLTVVLYPHRRIRITELLPLPTPEKSIGPTPEAESTELTTEAGIIPYSTGFLHKHAISIANVENVELEPFDKKSQVSRALATEIITVMKEIALANALFRDQVANFTMSQPTRNPLDEPEELADFAAAVSSGESTDLQGVLESMIVEDRLRKALVVLKKELMNTELQTKLSRDVETKIQKRQREYFLMEQLKGIKKELGLESDGKDKLVEKFKEKAESLNMPEAVRKVFDEEINKLQHLEPAASEFNVTRNYLDWLTQIPWGVHSDENYDMRHAKDVLDEDHYGLKDVKNRILEFLAVGKLRGTVEGKILCFVGPPGVGKTSIGKSIAKALDRKFFRFSVGGLSDVAEIKGHRRTYVGAMPGKIIQALKKVQTENPLVLIDEVDKLGRGHNGDPASALLEMLDPEQNSQFLDHYLDVPVDLSQVLFVCTANTLDTIPAPLLDRMEVLEVSGYITEEKTAIAARYLVPQAKEGSGLKDADVQLTDDAIGALIRYYCRESGVRRLKQQIEKVFRKSALKIVNDLEPAKEEKSTEEAATKEKEKPKEEEPTVAASELKEGAEEPANKIIKRTPMEIPADVHVRIGASDLLDYVGPAPYQKDRLYISKSPVGVSCGLGYLGNGSGSVMPIEVTVMPGSGNIQLTGKLGEVIKESAQIALSFLKSNAYSLGLTDDPTVDLMDKKSLHLHMPEGSIGKEGPSAGIAILTALVSLFSKQGISADLAMTGEMTLAGQVLPVGGLKEKILAAHRAGITKILAPDACRPDIEYNVPESVKQGIEIIYVSNVAQVIEEAFKGSPITRKLAGLDELLLPRDDSKERVD